MFSCLNCGYVFEEPVEWFEETGEQWTGCPNCGEGYEEASICEFCNEIYSENKLHGGMCDDCLELYYDHPKECYEVAKKSGEKEEIKLNLFLTYSLTIEQMEQILLEHIISSEDKKKICKEFIDEDKDWFAENALKGGVVV